MWNFTLAVNTHFVSDFPKACGQTAESLNELIQWPHWQWGTRIKKQPGEHDAMSLLTLLLKLETDLLRHSS